MNHTDMLAVKLAARKNNILFADQSKGALVTLQKSIAKITSLILALLFTNGAMANRFVDEKLTSYAVETNKVQMPNNTLGNHR